MDSLVRAQAELYATLRAFGPCFLRICADEDALWVSDLPRRRPDTRPAEAALDALGVECRLNADSLLWKLDWTQARYRALEAALPRTPPAFPQRPFLEDAYALCRLLLLHPAPLSRQPLAVIREVLKLDASVLTERPEVLRRLHGQCAAALRLGEPLPSLAGGLLCDWINSMERGMNA